MSLGKHYTPFWLHTLDNAQRATVVAWLQAHDVEVDRCASFHYDGDTVVCHMYAMNENGRPQITTTGDPVMAQDQPFHPINVPPAVRSYL